MGFANSVNVRKMAVLDAVRQQREALVKQPGGQRASAVERGNLLVKFEGGNQLVMLLGQGKLGSGITGELGGQMLAANQIQQPAAIVQQQITTVNPALLYIAPCAPRSNKVLVFDCLDDDYNVVSPKPSQQAKAYLESLGYSVTMALNNSANLANATPFR